MSFKLRVSRRPRTTTEDPENYKPLGTVKYLGGDLRRSLVNFARSNGLSPYTVPLELYAKDGRTRGWWYNLNGQYLKQQAYEQPVVFIVRFAEYAHKRYWLDNHVYRVEIFWEEVTPITK